MPEDYSEPRFFRSHKKEASPERTGFFLCPNFWPEKFERRNNDFANMQIMKVMESRKVTHPSGIKLNTDLEMSCYIQVILFGQEKQPTL
jgi:hypothetical protein